MGHPPIKTGFEGARKGGSGIASDISGATGKAADPQYPDNFAIYRQGEPAPVGNVHGSFAAAHAQLAAVGGGVLVVDASLGSCVVPSGSFDMSAIELRAASASTQLVCQDGALLPNLGLVTRGLRLISDSTSAVVVATSGTMIITFEGLSFAEANAGKAALIKCDGSANLFLLLRESSKLTAQSGAEPLEMTSSGSASLRLISGSCEVDTDSIKGNAGSVDIRHNVPLGTASKTQTNYTGTLTTSYPGDGYPGVGKPFSFITATPHNAAWGDYRLSVDTSTIAAASVLNLPTAASVGAGYELVVKDSGSSAGTYKIDVTATGGDTVDNAALYSINVDDGAAVFTSDGVNNWEVS